MRNIISILCGMLFGLGLAISEMINPARVIGFLDITGEWDPTLVLVMASALGLVLVTFRMILKRRNPVLAGSFSLPGKTQVDARLVTGAVLFGVGWGLGGFCPGPAIAALVTLSGNVFLFVAAMLLGYAAVSFIESRT